MSKRPPTYTVGNTLKLLKTGFLILFLTVIFGTFGFMVIEGWNFFDSLYMTIITITTTGFEEVHPLSTSGEIFTVVLILVSFGTILYVGGTGIQYLIESKIFRRRRMLKKIEDLEKHYIVCGFGRMGKHICEELVREDVPFVVIEKNPDHHERLEEMGYLFVTGDASSDSTLTQVGIKKADGIVTVLSTDAENVFTALTAKVLNPEIFVVSRAIEEDTESKLLRAGADRVVKPYELGGVRLAQLLLRPGVMEFIDVVAGAKNVDLHIEEITVKEGSSMHGKTLAELPLRGELNIIIVSIQNEEKGIFVYNPRSDTRVDEGNKLIAIGEKKNLDKLAEL